ncbi:MAG: hypothetical protein KGJ23_08095 [Euryarchaeota archaeon]|nr:hypothetical protein [Euryarchaeota archaeon]MDE1836562.1 hypothetical protein [Euryarchaeota archaeon]MDE1879243.1 hypothetical protein [Euryarchaeota archaeon]MDE2044532.1 hypothetical protein [Thermoplasmata archaeon]
MLALRTLLASWGPRALVVKGLVVLALVAVLGLGTETFPVLSWLGLPVALLAGVAVPLAVAAIIAGATLLLWRKHLT